MCLHVTCRILRRILVGARFSVTPSNASIWMIMVQDVGSLGVSPGSAVLISLSVRILPSCTRCDSSLSFLVAGVCVAGVALGINCRDPHLTPRNRNLMIGIFIFIAMNAPFVLACSQKMT